MCRHIYFCDIDYNPTREEINIFRLRQCKDCGRWLSFVDIVKDDKVYKEIEIERKGFANAFQKIVWH